LNICPAEKKQDLFQRKKKQTVAHFLAVAQPPAINLNTNAIADLFILFGCRSTLASFCFAARASPAATPSLRWLSVTATPPLTRQKKLFTIGTFNAFFPRLGCYCWNA
jgi:hypothetical protein